ncbi:MAG TPA: TetR/AcrR family transcriptional regulator [Ktedonobacteraceae bacterium]|nr:TetR/AcrR family transcriptional regulator [Ktedonobacteraceae bacterium]
MGIKQRRERERQATQQAILLAALSIAAEEGWQAMTIRHVAERIEYSPSAIYKYFEDKDAILLALLRQGFQHMSAALEHIAAQERNPSERLLQIATAYWDFVWHHPTVYQLMFDLKGSVHEVKEAKTAFLVARGAIEEWSQANGVRMADLDAAVDILWATMHGLVALTMAHHIYGGETRAKDLLSQAVNTLLLAWKTPSQL